jgi:hypothetical protein
MSQTPNTAIAVIGIDIGKNSFHVVGHDARGAIVLRQKWSRGQAEARLANIPPCLVPNQNARALISMMARSKCSNQRPDTLMQDRSPPARRNHLQRAAGPYIRVNRVGLTVDRVLPVPPPSTDVLRAGRYVSNVPTTAVGPLMVLSCSWHKPKLR